MTRAFDDDGNPLPTCKECGAICATFEESQNRLCANCGPGSYKARGIAVSGTVLKSCKDCGRILDTFDECRIGLCWLCGPGSLKWQEREAKAGEERMREAKAVGGDSAIVPFRAHGARGESKGE